MTGNDEAGTRHEVRTVALFGASGLVGDACLHALLDRPQPPRVLAFGRSRLERPPESPQLEQRVIDFDHLERLHDQLDVDAVVVALGTTMRKAGSREAFRHVDHDLPLGIARVAAEQGVPHYLLVSSIGADPGSSFFYSRVKGDLERAVRALAFPALTILRPSVLLGERDEFRLGEWLGGFVMRLIPGRLRAVQARDVGRVLAAQACDARAPGRGERIMESDEIRAHADGARNLPSGAA